MDTTNEITPGYISRAIADIRKIKPDFGLLLDLYERIFIEQESSKHSIHLPDFRISDEALAVKRKERFPLVDMSQFIIDGEAATALFVKLCGILTAAGDEVSETVKKIAAAVENKNVTPGDLFPAFLRGDESLFGAMEKEFAISSKILGFVIYNSMKPSLSVFSAMLSKYLDDNAEWDRGYCPVCGSTPELSIFQEGGKRSLLCGFCGHTWPSRRVFCTSCGNTDHETLRYYEIEEEEEYRVDVCDACKRYIKTVDATKTSRTLYLPLENISTPYIDVKFNEMGYKSASIPIDK